MVRHCLFAHFLELCWCEIPETLTAYMEPAVANMRAEIKPRHPLCPFITPSAPLLAATSPFTLRLGDNGSGGQWCDLHLDQWDICKHGTSANHANDVVLYGVKWTQTRTAGLGWGSVRTCGYLPRNLNRLYFYLHPFVQWVHFHVPISVLQV